MIILDDSWTFPLDETYVAFGDGSETDAGVFYGFILLPDSTVEKASQILSDVKRSYGGNDENPIHCRSLFSGHSRAKTAWSHLSALDCATMCGEILRQVESLSPCYLLTHYPIQHFPKRLRLKGKNGHADLVHPVDAKWMLLWSCLHTAALLDPAIISAPANPLEIPPPHTLPFWDMVMKRSDPGPRVSAVYLDRETTNVSWFSKRFQWMTVARLLTIETPRGSSLLPIVEDEPTKHPLLELADLFIYSLARELSGKSPIPLGGSNAKVLLMLRGSPMEELILGG